MQIKDKKKDVVRKLIRANKAHILNRLLLSPYVMLDSSRSW